MRALRFRQPRARHTRGEALVELALVTTTLIFLLVGALDLGRVFYGQIAVTDAAKEGALVASQGGTKDPNPNATCNPTTNTIMCAVVSEAKGGMVEVVPANVTASTCPATPTSSTPPSP